MPPPSARKPPGGSGGSLLSDSDGHRVGARVHRTTERHGSAHRTTTFGAYGQVALAGELERIEQAPHGMRHHSVYGASARIGQLIAGGELDEAEAVKRLMAMALTIELPYSDAKRAVERGIEKGKLRPRSAPLKDPIETRTDARVEILNWWGGVLGSHWSGQRRATTFKILAGVFALAQRLGKLEFKASYREVAQVAGVSLSTVAEHRGEWSRFVRKTRKANATTGSSTTWKLSGRFPNSLTALPTDSERLFGFRAPPLNAWHGRSVAWRVHDELSDEGQTVSELARRLGVQPRTVRGHLRRFATDGLAVQDADGLWFLGPVEPEEVELDGIDHAAKQRERYRLDRERDRKWRADRLNERERDR